MPMSLWQRLPRETRDYVPMILAAIVIARKVEADQMARAEDWFRRWGLWSLLLAWAPGGDVLVAVDGKAVTDSASMLNLIAALKPGSETTLRLMREAKAVELRVTVGKRPPKQARKE